MGTTVPMPPWMRKIQQSYYYAIGAPAAVGYMAFLITDGCISEDFSNFTIKCAQKALWGAVVALIVKWVSGHSVGSTAFATDGSTIAAAPALKELADAAVTVKAKAADRNDTSTGPQDAAQAVRMVKAIETQVAIAATQVQAQAEAK